MLNVPLNKRAIDLTAADMLEIAKEAVSIVLNQSEGTKSVDEGYVFGLAGIQEIFGCKKTKAWKIKKSGILDDAISEVGRNFSIDVAKAREVCKRSNLL